MPKLLYITLFVTLCWLSMTSARVTPEVYETQPPESSDGDGEWESGEGLLSVFIDVWQAWLDEGGELHSQVSVVK